MRKPPRWYHILLGMLAALFFLTLSFMLAFFLTTWLYAQIGQAPPLWVQQLINSLVGFVIFIFFAASGGTLTRNRQRDMQMGIFGPIFDALNRIAQGDFTARVPEDMRPMGENEPMGLLAKRVNTLAQELSQMEEMRQEFVSNVSHEIQSPLTSIRGFARALQNEQLSQAERAHYLNIIETETMRLAKLSENLLALASLDAETVTLEPKPFRLDTQIREIVLAMEPQWRDQELEMEISADPVTIAANQDLLRQVWTNLLHNSIKFTPPHGKICIGVQAHDAVVETEITDTGIGIAPADQAHVLERFFKADTSRERSRGGNGLGLAIVKEIVELHHGKIDLTSQPGAGTTFRVTLPVN